MNKDVEIMNRKKYIGIFIVNVLVELILLFILMSFKLYVYALFFVVLLFITISIFVNFYKSTSSEESIYFSYLNHIKKSFNSILVQLESLPNLKGKSIINVSELENLLDLQLELKKPILYYEEFHSCTFIIISDYETYIYVLRMYDDVTASIDYIFKDYNISNYMEYKNDFSSLSNTVIIKLDNFRKIVAIKEQEKLIDLPKLKN